MNNNGATRVSVILPIVMVTVWAPSQFSDRCAMAQVESRDARAGGEVRAEQGLHATALSLFALVGKPASESLPILFQAARSHDSQLRAIAAEVLASTRSIEALEFLFVMQDDTDRHVSETARRAVFWWYDVKAVVAQQCRIVQGGNVDEALRAIRIVRFWGGPIDLECLAFALESDEPKIRVAALEAVEARYGIAPKGDEAARLALVKKILSVGR